MPEALSGVGDFLEEKECEFLLSSLCPFSARKNFTLLTGGLFNHRGRKIFDTCQIINRDEKKIGFSARDPNKKVVQVPLTTKLEVANRLFDLIGNKFK